MSKKLVYSFDPYIKVYTENFKQNDKLIKNFHKIKLLDGTMVILEDNDKILLCKEYRRAFKKFVWNLPGGVVEKKYSPLNTIKKELFEETGIKGKKWKFLKKFKRHGNYDCGTDYVYFSKKLSQIEKSEFPKKNLHWISLSKIKEIIAKDKFLTPGVISALYFYLLYKNKYI